MGVSTAVRLWRGLDEHAAAHGKTMRVHLAGGEPFHDWVRLVAVIRAARDAGQTSLEKIETNAFWATDDGLTRARLELLDALGLERLAVSTDVFHQEYVPFERVQRCVAIARNVLGRGRVSVRRWDFFQNPVDVPALTPAEKRRVFLAALKRHPERLTGRAAMQLAPLLPGQPAATFAGQCCASEILHSRHVHIDPYGNIFPGTCAGIILGRAGPKSVEEVWRRMAASWPQHAVAARAGCGRKLRVAAARAAAGIHRVSGWLRQQMPSVRAHLPIPGAPALVAGVCGALRVLFRDASLKLARRLLPIMSVFGRSAPASRISRERVMPQFMAIHTVTPKSITIQQVRDLSRAAQEDPKVKGRHSVGNLSEGKVVCVLEAPTKADVAAFFKDKGLPFDLITQVEFEGDGNAIRVV